MACCAWCPPRRPKGGRSRSPAAVAPACTQSWLACPATGDVAANHPAAHCGTAQASCGPTGGSSQLITGDRGRRMTADSVATSEDDVQAVRQWVRLSCTDPGTHLPALAEIGGAPAVRARGAVRAEAARRRRDDDPPRGLPALQRRHDDSDRAHLPADADRDPPELRARRAVHDPLRSSRPSTSAPRKPRPRCARWWPKGC